MVSLKEYLMTIFFLSSKQNSFPIYKQRSITKSDPNKRKSLSFCGEKSLMLTMNHNLLAQGGMIYNNDIKNLTHS